MLQYYSRQFLTLREAAAIIYVSKRALQRLIRRQIGGQWRVPENRFMKWISDQMVPITKLQYFERP